MHTKPSASRVRTSYNYIIQLFTFVFQFLGSTGKILLVTTEAGKSFLFLYCIRSNFVIEMAKIPNFSRL